MTTTKTAKTYAYAVVPTQGMYGSGSTVYVAARGDDLAKMQAKAKRLGIEYRKGMAPYGGSSGGYRVIAWNESGKTIDGYTLDRCPNAK